MTPRPEIRLPGRQRSADEAFAGSAPKDTYIILYDGICRLCNRLNRFVLHRDSEGAFRFASLQSRFARDVLEKHNRSESLESALHVVVRRGNEPEQVLTRARAVLHILKQIGGPWRVAGWLGFLPTVVLDFGYDLVARSRYRWFGKLDSCPLPDPEHQDRFIEI